MLNEESRCINKTKKIKVLQEEHARSENIKKSKIDKIVKNREQYYDRCNDWKKLLQGRDKDIMSMEMMEQSLINRLQNTQRREDEVFNKLSDALQNSLHTHIARLEEKKVKNERIRKYYKGRPDMSHLEDSMQKVMKERSFMEKKIKLSQKKFAKIKGKGYLSNQE